ncbi:MAG: WD40 repeat domain-containing protein [Acidobacteria bacterium]|nr:WD40 repeat domain-containing protein [Acidobacteriota bacterium]
MAAAGLGRIRHSDRTVSTDATRDGRTLALAGFDSIVSVWNLATGERQLELEGLESSIVYLAFSHDGIHLAAANMKLELCVWDLRSSQPVSRAGPPKWKGPAQILYPDAGEARLVALKRDESLSPCGRFLAGIRSARTPLWWCHRPDSRGPEIFVTDQHDGSEMASLHLVKTEFGTVPSRTVWARDGSWTIGLWSKEECGIWQPMENRFMSQPLSPAPSYHSVYGAAVLPDLTMICAALAEAPLIVAPPGPERVSPLLTPWERYKQRRDSQPRGVSTKTEFIWDLQGIDGQGGVRVEPDHLSWSSGARQRLADFLAYGPLVELPSQTLVDLYDTVQAHLRGPGGR